MRGNIRNLSSPFGLRRKAHAEPTERRSEEDLSEIREKYKKKVHNTILDKDSHETRVFLAVPTYGGLIRGHHSVRLGVSLSGI